MPSWIIAGWFANAPERQHLAVAHWHKMRRDGWTTVQERFEAHEYNERRRLFGWFTQLAKGGP